MCTARTKLKEVEQEMDCLYAELRSVKMDRDQAIKETKAAEEHALRVAQRNMCLTRNADLSNCFMCASLMISFVLCGLLVYVL